MRIIAGEAKGTRLLVPKGPNVRPSLDRVRESLFSMLGGRVAGARFLDLYAGSGANGIEALSRGAEYAVFVDKDIRFVRENLRKTHLNTRAACVCANLPGGVAKLQGRAPFDIVFADPPFKQDDFTPLLARLADSALLAPGGVIVLEHTSRKPLADTFGPFEKDRERRYGETQLTFYLDASAPMC